MKIKAILFDCDGVLIDSEHLVMLADMKYFKTLGLEYSEEEYHAKFLGSTFDQNIRVIKADMQEQLGKHAPENLKEALNKGRYQSLRNDLEPIEGVANFVSNLSLKIAVASNTITCAWLAEKLEIAGLKTYFAPHIYAAEVVKHEKPAPDLYLYAAEKLGVMPENCMVVEDSPRGAQAGIAAGMHTVGYAGANGLPDSHADKLKAVGCVEVFKNMSELGDYVALLQSGHVKRSA